MEYSGTIAKPDGCPAAVVPFWFENWTGCTPRPRSATTCAGRPTPRGGFRLRMPKTHPLAIYLMPEDLAPFQHDWGVDVRVSATMGSLG